MARTAYYSYTWDDNGATFDFADGTTAELEWAQLDAETKLRLMAHGLKQKTIDAGAIPRDEQTGRSASLADKIAASMVVFGRVARNQWTAPREGGSGGRGSLLLRALMRLQPAKSREELAMWLAQKSKTEQAALRASAKIAPIIEQIKAETVGAIEVDTDALMAELD